MGMNFGGALMGAVVLAIVVFLTDLLAGDIVTSYVGVDYATPAIAGVGYILLVLVGQKKQLKG